MGLLQWEVTYLENFFKSVVITMHCTFKITLKKYAIIRKFHYNPFTHAPLHIKFVPASLNGTA